MEDEGKMKSTLKRKLRVRETVLVGKRMELATLSSRDSGVGDAIEAGCRSEGLPPFCFVSLSSHFFEERVNDQIAKEE